MTTIQSQILMLQAKLMLLVGLGFLVVGLWLGNDPLITAFRAALAALVAVTVGGLLLRIGARIIQRRLAELEEAGQSGAPVVAKAAVKAAAKA